MDAGIDLLNILTFFDLTEYILGKHIWWSKAGVNHQHGFNDFSFTLTILASSPMGLVGPSLIRDNFEQSCRHQNLEHACQTKIQSGMTGLLKVNLGSNFIYCLQPMESDLGITT